MDASLHSDAGQYKVTLENKLGVASATINVKVIGTVQIQLLSFTSLFAALEKNRNRTLLSLV